MSWAVQVKTYFAAAFIMVASIIFSIILSIVTKNSLNLDVFLVAFLVQVIMASLINKGKNKWFSIFLPMIPVIIYEYIFYPLPVAIITIAFVFFLNIIFTDKYNNILSYDWYKIILTKSIYIIFLFSTICAFLNGGAILSLYRYIIIYFVLMIICLREALGYSYQIRKNSRLRLTNAILAIGSILLTRESVFNAVRVFTIYLKNVFQLIIDKLIDLLFIIMKKPLEWLFLFFKNIMVKDPKIEEIYGEVTSNVVEDTTYVAPVFWSIIDILLKVLFIALIIIVVIKIIKKISAYNAVIEDENYTEVTEELEIVEDNKKLKSFNNYFRKKGSSREEIIYFYERFVNFGNKKGILKTYMTPRQVENIIKISVEEGNEFSEVTEAYNEAKFSLHAINDNSEKKVKNVLDKTMKKL